MTNFMRIFISIVLSFLAIVCMAIPLGKVSSPAFQHVDDTLLEAMEEANPDPEFVAEKIYLAESSRQQVIQDSIDASVRESISVEESIAESISIEESIELSIAESVLASIEESEEAEKAAQEASRQAAIAASIEAARRESLAARPTVPPVSFPVTGGLTLLFGDSRTSGFTAYGCYPDGQVLWSYDPITSAKNQENLARAAALAPEKIVFLNGIDDLISYGLIGSRDRYEAAIRSFQSRSAHTQIFVGSVLPCRMDFYGAAKHPILAETESYNGLLIDMCNRNGWTYLDTSAGFSYAAFGSNGDGIHFTPAWTRQWLQNIRSQAGF